MLKTVDGTKIAPKLWFLTAINVFKKLGSVQNKIDPCCLVRSDILPVFVLSVDDAGNAATSMKAIDELVEKR